MARKRQLLQPQPKLNNLGGWFRNSLTILVSRLIVLEGFLIAAIGGMDWSNIFSLDFSQSVYSKQNLTIGGLAVLHGIVVEAARRRPGSVNPV